MPAPRRLRGSKAAPGPSEKSRVRAGSIGAYHAGQNATARGVSRVGRQAAPTQRASTTSARSTGSGPFAGGLRSADIFKDRGATAFGRRTR